MASGDTLLLFSPWCNEPPGSAFATPDVHAGHPVLAFDDETPEAALFRAVMPRQYRGGGVTVRIGWMSVTTRYVDDAGDQHYQVGAWQFRGGTPDNTGQYSVYWELGVAGGLAVVSVYRDAAKARRLASGSIGHAAGGLVTLAPDGDGGLSGSVLVAASAVPDADPENLLVFRSVAWEVAWQRERPGVDNLEAEAFAASASVEDLPAEDAGRLVATAVDFADGEAMGHVAAGDPFCLRIRRDPAAPQANMTGDAELVFIEVRET